MAVPHDIDSKQISDSVAIKHGIAALLNSSASSEQRLFDAYDEQKKRADDFEKKYYDKCDECDDLKTQLDEAKAIIANLMQKPVVQVTLKGKAKLNKLITGDLHEIYAENDSDTGQQHKRISAG